MEERDDPHCRKWSDDSDLPFSSSMEERDDPHCRKWCDLPLDIIELISFKIGEIEDFVRFRCVCERWRCYSSTKNRFSQQLPWLVLPHNSESSSRSFFSISTRTIITLDLPETRNLFICGSSNGWLLLLGHFLKFSLFNPLTRSIIDLPPITVLPQGFTRVGNRLTRHGKMIPLEQIILSLKCELFISMDPKSASGFTGMVFFAHFSLVQYWNVGDGDWSSFDSGLPNFLYQILHHKGRIFAIDRHGNVSVGDVGGLGKGLLVPSLKVRSQVNCLLLPLPDELLLVTNDRMRISENFKLEEKNGSMSWLSIEGFTGYTVFLSNHGQIGQEKLVGTVRDVPGFKNNCLYYTVFHRSGGRLDGLVLEPFEYRQFKNLQSCPCFIPRLY